MIEVNGLDFGYGKKLILKDIDISIGEKEVISLIGPNGSGKSTLLRCLSGLVQVDKSKIWIKGEPLSRYKSKEISKQIGFLPQFQKSTGTIRVYELVAMGRTPYHKSGWFYTKEDREKIDWAINYMNLEEIRHEVVEMLSGGQKQRVWIAMVLAQDTPIVLLDEPVTYMDMKHQCELLDVIRHLRDDFGKTVISVFHDINHALEVSDKICLLKDGEIYDMGKPEDVLTEKSIADVYEVNASICKVDSCIKSFVVPHGLHKRVCKKSRKKIREYAV